VPVPPDEPVILGFEIEPAAPSAGQTATVRWTSTGGTAATLMVWSNSVESYSVAVSGTTTVWADCQPHAPTMFVNLTLINDGGESDSIYVQIHVSC